jgi:hypothetical protein
VLAFKANDKLLWGGLYSRRTGGNGAGRRPHAHRSGFDLCVRGEQRRMRMAVFDIDRHSAFAQ